MRLQLVPKWHLYSVIFRVRYNFRNSFFMFEIHDEVQPEIFSDIDNSDLLTDEKQNRDDTYGTSVTKDNTVSFLW